MPAPDDARPTRTLSRVLHMTLHLERDGVALEPATVRHAIEMVIPPDVGDELAGMTPGLLAGARAASAQLGLY